MPYARSNEQLLANRLLPRRERNGQRQRSTAVERSDNVLAVAFAQPHRRAMPSKWTDDDGKTHPVHPSDPRGGYVLGRLCLSGQITETQLRTADKVAERLKAYIAIKTPGGMGYGAQDFNRSGGASCAGDLSDATIARINEDMAEIEHALRETPSPAECLEALVMVCILEQEPRPADLGHVRIGLNAIGRTWA